MPLFTLEYELNLFLFLSKMHLAGKTDEAKADLSRLAKIRADREAAQAKRKAELDGMIISNFSLSLVLSFIFTFFFFSTCHICMVYFELCPHSLPFFPSHHVTQPN